MYITSRRFTTLPQSRTSIRVYSNADTVEMKLNGSSLGPRAAANHVFVWNDLSWARGANTVEARAGSQTDSVTWMN